MFSGVRAFAAVARRGSFSAAADDERTTQPVISRRIAALEEVLGGRLIQRDTRPVGVTPLGKAILGNVQELLNAERALLDTAAGHRSRTFRLLVPRNCDPSLWAVVRVRAATKGRDLEVQEDDRQTRALRFHSGEGDAAVLPVDSAQADWLIPLGLAQLTDQRSLTLTSLRPTRADLGNAQRIVLLPEDAGPALQTTLQETAGRYGLAATQIRETPSPVSAIAGALAGDDWILSTQAEARAWRLSWLPVRELPLSRAYRLETRAQEDANMFDTQLKRDVAAALGATGSPDR